MPTWRPTSKARPCSSQPKNQGLTEFLPVSSSGHLILVPWFFGWEEHGLAFDVGLHVGTTLALLVYFWRDWARMAFAAAGDLRRHAHHVRAHSPDAQLVWYILIGSVPAGLAGILFGDAIEEHVRQPWLIAVMLVLVGLVMLVTDRRARRERTLGSITVTDAILVGIAQAIALIPGVSRSGATISVGLARGLDREAAARFAFLLGTPAFVGAAILKLPDLAGSSGSEYGQLGVGLTVSALTGILVIHFLMRFLRRYGLVPFVVYRFGLAALVAVVGLARM